MGIYSPSDNNPDADSVRINSVVAAPTEDLIEDTLLRTLSRTNDLAHGAFGRLRDWHSGVGSLLDAFQDETASTLGKLSPLGLGLGRARREPNEIVSRGIPSPAAYDECSKAQGLPLWDQYGLWHCLFPRSKIPYDYRTGERSTYDYDDGNNLISKEDVEADTDNKHGLFFRSLEDLLGWQAGMRRAMQQEKSRYFTSAPSREVSTEIRTLDNGDVQRHTVETTTDGNGVTHIKETTQVLASDGTVKESKTEER